MSGKSQYVQEDIHAGYQMGVGGDLVHLLYDLNLCLPCELGNEEAELGPNKFLCADSYFRRGTVHQHAKPRTFDSVVQHVIRMKTRPGREDKRLSWEIDRRSVALLRVWVIADIRILTEVEEQRGRVFQSDPQYRFKGAGVPGREAEAGEWMMEEQLEVLQMDDVTIGVTIDECVNLGSDEECALVDGY